MAWQGKNESKGAATVSRGKPFGRKLLVEAIGRSVVKAYDLISWHYSVDTVWWSRDVLDWLAAKGWA